MNFFYGFAKGSTAIFMKLFYRLKIVNPERLKDCKSVIIAANHTSLKDPPFIGAIIPNEISFLAKAELFKNIFFRRMITSLNAIPIMRNQLDMNAIKKAIIALEDNKSLLMFPEGTRRGKTIKPGIGLLAMKTKKDILPIYIQHPNSIFSAIFKKNKLIIKIGELIKIESFLHLPSDKNSYQIIAEKVFDNIMELAND